VPQEDLNVLLVDDIGGTKKAGGHFMRYRYSAAVLAVLYILRKSRYERFSPVEDSL